MIAKQKKKQARKRIAYIFIVSSVIACYCIGLSQNERLYLCYRYVILSESEWCWCDFNQFNCWLFFCFVLCSLFFHINTSNSLIVLLLSFYYFYSMLIIVAFIYYLNFICIVNVKVIRTKNIWFFLFFLFFIFLYCSSFFHEMFQKQKYCWHFFRINNNLPLHCRKSN